MAKNGNFEIQLEEEEELLAIDKMVELLKIKPPSNWDKLITELNDLKKRYIKWEKSLTGNADPAP